MNFTGVVNFARVEKLSDLWGNLTVYFRVCVCVLRLRVILLLVFSVVVIIMFANARPNWAHQQVPGFSFRLSDLKFQFQLVYFFSMRICLGVCVR